MRKLTGSFVFLLVVVIFFVISSDFKKLEIANNAQVPPKSNGNSVQVWLTDVPSKMWITRQHDVAFKSKKADQALSISVNEKQKYQSVLGFGAALTDSSSWLIAKKMSKVQREALMRKLFDSKKGIGLSFIRLPMGATDLSASGDYSYDDLTIEASDPTLSNFSIKHDKSYIIPELKQARSLNSSIKIMANPWSPPGWMKTTYSMEGGTLEDNDYTVLANYFVKTIQQYKAAGIPISYISPQNEPQNTAGYPSMNLSAEQESHLIQDIGQAFKKNQLSTQILAWDHNWDQPSYPEQIYSNPDSSLYTSATAWHCYAGDVTAQSKVHNDYPGKGVLISECSGGTWQGSTQDAFRDEVDNLIINGMRNWAEGVMLWNIALDLNQGPTNNGCTTCNGLVMVNQDDGYVKYNTDYYALGQASKFVKPGARRIYSNTYGTGSIENVAFINPNGSKVLIAYNSGKTEKSFSVSDGIRSFDYSLKAGDAVTFKWAGPPQNSHDKSVLTDSNVQSHDFTFDLLKDSNSKPITVTYDPSFKTNDVSFITQNKLLTYSMPYGSTIQTIQDEVILNRDHWKITAPSERSNSDVTSNAVDGDLSTRWSSGHGQTSGDWFEINLGSAQSFNKLSLDTGTNNSGDYIRDFQVFVSNDGLNWGHAIMKGVGNGEKLNITVPQQTAQYIRIVSTGSSGSWWSIGEVNVYTPLHKNSSTVITGPTAIPNTLQMQTWESPIDTKVSVVYNSSSKNQSFPISEDHQITYTLPAGAALIFTESAQSDLKKPALTDLSAISGIAGQAITINGSNFGNEQGLGSVYFGSTPASVLSWSNDQISAVIPHEIQSGKITVSVFGNNGLQAGTTSFTIKIPVPLVRTGWSMTASDLSPYGDDPENMLDGYIDTRYSSGKGQYNGGWIQIDMGQQQTFDEIILDSGSSAGDYARNADVFVSKDGASWTKVTSIMGIGPMERITFPLETARYIKMVNTSSSGSWWSIAELNVDIF